MRKTLLVTLLLIVTCPWAHAGAPANTPSIGGLQLVAQFPAELPQRLSGFAYDGEKFWATVYHGRGRYATLDPSTLLWTINNDAEQHRTISDVSGLFQSPAALCFINRELWVAGSYGQSFGSIDTQDWKIQRVFKGKQREDPKSQAYASMAFDGRHLWIAWHWLRYELPTSQTQLLLKIEPETGKVVAEYPVPAGTRIDLTHGLTWDGSMLWHAKDNRLSAIDPATGQVVAGYLLPQIKRPSGLAWDGYALWIAEFDGKIWRLPVFANP
ncbi:MAG TPA: hypothetical protein VFY34_01085 [Pyrinomonadaceae bacterium]|nr:hypothetical protein [Pyrinomonadaceae bacterium]